MSTETATITDIQAADDLMAKLHAERVARGEDDPWVSVFWDRGWGDSGQVVEVTIIADGDGQKPHALITAELCRELKDAGVIETTNSLQTFKARRLFNYIPASARAAAAVTR